MKTLLVSIATVALMLQACKTAEVRPTAAPPSLPSQELAVVSQSLTDFKVKLTAKVESAEPVTLEKADFELVADGKVLKSGQLPFKLAVAPGAPVEVTVDQSAEYATPPPTDADAPTTPFLAALRGNFTFRSGEKTVTVPFARSREIRMPRPPRIKLSEIKAARYADNESEITIRLGVQNPNPFEIAMSSLNYTVSVDNKQIVETTVGQGERVSPAGTAVFDAQVLVNESTHGKDVVKLIKSQTLPYVITAKLVSGPHKADAEFKGNLKLNVSK